VRRHLGVDLVAFVLAFALAVTVVLVTITALINVIVLPKSLFSLGENTTQVLTTVLGGILGLLGTYIGHRLAHVERVEQGDEWPEPQPSQHLALPHWPDRQDTAEIPPKDPPAG
jgi:hypothetical protein